MSQRPGEDDERTIVRPSSGRAGPGAPASQLGHQLPIGTHVRDYEITGLIGEGGFGIVYLAYDHSLERRVAIKEYMPSSMAARVNGTATVVVKSERHQETFKAGLKSFVNEARLLARFDHPALVKVYRFWEEHGTAYMVMPYYEGPTLKSALATRGSVPDEAALRAWLSPLLDALGVMHAAQCYHRDIAPDNILLTQGGPLLLDFGAARRVIGDMTHALTVVLKPGYAPIEQYGDVATMTQGAWTDLYALACVVYFAITGKVPMSSVERLMDDRLEPLSRLAAGRYSPGFLAAIDAALAVRPQDRPQSEAQFRALLGGPGAAAPRSGFGSLTSAEDPTTRIVVDPRTAPPASTPSWATQPPVPTSAPPTTGPATGALMSAQAEAPHHASTAVPAPAPHAVPAPGPALDAAPPPSQAASTPRAAANRLRIYLGGAAVVVVAVVAAALYFAGEPAPATAPSPGIAATPVAPPEAASAAATLGAPPTVAEAASAPAAATTPAQKAEPAPPAAAEPRAAPATTAAEPRTAPSAAAVEPRSVPTEAATATPPARPRARREAAPDAPAAPAAEGPDATKPPPSRTGVTPSRCSDILQKASLEPLNAEEAAFLKRECR